MRSLSHETQGEYEASGKVVRVASNTRALGAYRRSPVSRSRAGEGQTAAGTADGALGRGRPAASGSRWRWNAADQDFSRRPATRLVNGGAVAIRAIRAPSAATAATRPISTAARTAVLMIVSAPAPVSRSPRCHRTAASASAPSRIPGTAAASRSSRGLARGNRPQATPARGPAGRPPDAPGPGRG